MASEYTLWEYKQRTAKSRSDQNNGALPFGSKRKPPKDAKCWPYLAVKVPENRTGRFANAGFMRRRPHVLGPRKNEFDHGHRSRSAFDLSPDVDQQKGQQDSWALDQSGPSWGPQSLKECQEQTSLGRTDSLDSWNLFDYISNCPPYTMDLPW